MAYFLGFNNKPLGFGGSPLSFSFCAAYQAVYDAYTTKPDAATAIIWNYFVEQMLASGEWDLLDYFNVYAAHTNGAGEALLDWKQPAGGAELVVDGAFNTGIGAGTWNTNLSWTIAGGKATFDDAANGNLFQLIKQILHIHLLFQ